MKCKNCNKRFDNFLILSNKKIVCPNCFNEIIVRDFELDETEENKEIFDLSEQLLFKGIKEKNIREVLDAFNLCKEAVDLDNPLAYIRLAYYYENLKEKEVGLNTLNKYILAAEYYISTIISKLSFLSNSYNEAQIKLNAANELLELASNHSEIVEFNNKYSIENLKAIIDKNNVEGYKLPPFVSNEKQLNNLEDIFTRLIEGNLVANVYFYKSKLSGEEVCKLLTEENVTNLYHKKVMIKLIERRNGEVIEIERGYNDALIDSIKSIDKARDFSIFIYNGSSISRLVPKQSCLDIFRNIKLEDVSINTLSDVVSYGFDDIYYVSKKNKLGELSEKFVNYMNEKGE